MRVLAFLVFVACFSSLTVVAYATDGGGSVATVAELVPATPATPVVDPVAAAEVDPLGTVDKIVSAVRAGEWRFVASLLLALLMVALSRIREIGPAKKFFSGDRGGAILVGILAVSGALASALATDARLDWRLFLGAAGVMWTAVGGYTWFKRIVWPKFPDDGPEE